MVAGTFFQGLDGGLVRVVVSSVGLINEINRHWASEFTCVRWKVTLCDPVWQVTPRSSEMTCQEELYRLTLTNLIGDQSCPVSLLT